MRKFARLLPLLAILALIALAAIVLLQTGPLAEHVRKVVQTELAKQLGRPVSIRKASVTVTGGVVLRDVVIKNKDGSPLLKAPVMEARVGGLRNALRGSAGVEVRSVYLRRPQLDLVRRPDGSWSVSDLIARTGKKPSSFRAAVTADDARITLVDETRGGQTTSIEKAEVSLRQPAQGRMEFRLRVGANEGILGSLDLRGESDSTAKTSKLSGKVVGLSVPYAVERIPGMTFLTASAGTADVNGKLTFGAQQGESRLTYDARAELRDTEVSFPWLRRHIKGIAGKLELADGDFTFDGMTGTVEGAPVQLDGQITDVPRAQFALDLSVTGIRYPQLRALFPRVAFPAGLLLPSPMRVQAKIEGPAGQVKVSGEATVKVIKFHAIPWHDLAGKFEYQNGRLRISKLRAHGSPRQFEADIEIDLRHGGRTTGSAALVNMPLAMLAEMAGIKGEFRGTAKANIRGATANGGQLSGDFTVERAAVQGVDLGRLSGEFVYRQGGVLLRRVRIRGPTADGVINADISRSGAYTLSADLASLDVSRMGTVLSAGGLRGQCCARVRASGQVRAGQATARVLLGPGELQGRPFDSIGASVVMTREEVRLRDLSFAAGAARGEGQVAVTGWRLSHDRARISGRLAVTGVALGELLPQHRQGIGAAGTVGGRAEISGTLASPVITTDLKGEAVELAGQSFPVASARLAYRRSRLVLEQIELRTSDSSLVASGGYTPEAGFAIDVTSKQLDLGAVNTVFPDFGKRFGLSVTGRLDLFAQVSGPLEGPTLRFKGTVTPLNVNGQVLDEFSASGTLLDTALHLETASLRWGESRISIAGDVDRAAQTIEVSADLEKVDLGTLMRVGDSAAWRVYQAPGFQEGDGADGFFDSALYKRYARIPRPLSGQLSGLVQCSGAFTQPTVAATFDVAAFGFQGRSVEKITGEIAVSLRRDKLGQMEVREGTGKLNLSQQLAEAWATAALDPDGKLKVDLETGNLELEEIGLWLNLPVKLRGQARIDVNITGTMANPVVRGGVLVDHLKVGSLPPLESVSAYPIRLSNGLLTVEELSLRNGPMEATGSATIRLDLSQPGSVSNLLAIAFSTADLGVTNAEFSPAKGMDPIRFNADLHAEGGTLYLKDGAGPTGSSPGIHGTMGSGKFTAGGTVTLGNFFMGQWSWGPSFDITANFDDAEVSIPDLFELTVNGQVKLENDAEGQPLITTEQDDPPAQRPLVISDAAVSLQQPEGFRSNLGGLFAPKLDVRLEVGSNVWLRRGSDQRPTKILFDPTRTAPDGTRSGYLDIGGIMTGQGVTLDGEFESRQGQLAFPNGVLTLQRATAWVTRAAGQKPVVTVSAEAEGRVGDYLVSLNPVGQIYPPQPRGESALALNLESLPRLESAYVMALLAGPVVAPSRGGQPDLATMLAEPALANGGGGEITGIRVPAFGNSLGMQELSLDVALAGSVRLRMGQRILKRLVVSYVSTLSGPVESRTLKLNYEVTPRYAIGYGVNELDQGRWEVNAFVPF